MGFLKKYTKPSPSPTSGQPSTSSSPSTSSPSSSFSSSSSSSSPSRSSSREQITQHPNTSTSNLSTTSTLIDTPQTHARPSAIDREAAERTVAQRSQAWPHDPWRGGFGPNVKSKVKISGRWMTAKEERREARREVGDWLRGNGLRIR